MWTYQGEPVDGSIVEEYVAFVYLITNKTNNKRYIGKKLLNFTRTKKIKGKRKRTKTESDWKTYYGSSNSLSEDVVLLGPDSFTREILHLCKSKGTANYLEAKEQILYRVLEEPGWYNDQIRVRTHRSQIKLP